MSNKPNKDEEAFSKGFNERLGGYAAGVLILLLIAIAIGNSLDMCATLAHQGIFLNDCREHENPQADSQREVYVVPQVVTATPAPRSSSDTSQNSANVGGSAGYEILAEHFYQGSNIDLNAYPEAGSNQVYLIHGDIRDDGQCNIAIFGHGHRPNETYIGNGGWRLIRLTGSNAQIDSTISTVQAGAASHEASQGGDGACPIISSIGW